MKKLLLALMIILIIFTISSCKSDQTHTHTVTGELIVIKEATCVEEGTSCMFCTECGKIVNTITIPKTNEHVETVIPALESTCTQKGYTEGKKCSQCGIIIVEQQETPLKAHTEEIMPEIESSCTKTGLSEGKKCSSCGEILVVQRETPIVAHTYDDKYDESCNICGYVRDAECAHGETEILEGYEATCTSTGLTDGEKCKKCGEILVSQTVISVKEHTEVIDEAVEPTCTEIGLTEGKHCGVCNAVLVAQTIISENGHTEIIDEKVEPTCTETGLTEGKHCSVCGEVIIAQEVINATGHSFGEWQTVKEPTTTEEGLNERYCECGETETATIPMLDADVGSIGLKYQFYDEGYSVVGIGTCEDADIVIPNTYNDWPITSIGDSAFKDCRSLTSVVIPDSVTSIGDHAFSWCDSLTSVVIPDSVTSIGESAFSICSSLTSIEIPDSVMSIGDGAFSSCSSLQYNEYDNACYLGNENNPYVVLISANNRNITNCEIHTDTRFIGTDAFAGLPKLTSIVITDSITSIGWGAFTGCYSLTSIEVDKNNEYYKSIDGNLYTKDAKTLIQYAIGKTETSFSILDYVTSIGDFAFAHCDSLTSIAIPNSVKSIGRGAFYNCDSLTSIEFGDNSQLTSVSFDAFYASDSLQYNEYDNAYYLGNKNNPYVVLIKANNTDITNCEIHTNTRIIAERAFFDCTFLISIVVPNLVTSIDEAAFTNCYSLTSVVIPDSVMSIGERAFEDGNSLIIYCEAESRPDGWHFQWCTIVSQVVWGYKGE